MTAWLLPVLAGFCTGILSAWGVGGGTLLLLLMTLFLGVEQSDAMAINLLYFLPTAAMGLLYHRKNGLLERPVLRAAAPWGTAAAAAAIKDSQCSLMGIRPVLSQRSRTSRESPRPSLPMATAQRR